MRMAKNMWNKNRTDFEQKCSEMGYITIIYDKISGKQTLAVIDKIAYDMANKVFFKEFKMCPLC